MNNDIPAYDPAAYWRERYDQARAAILATCEMTGRYGFHAEDEDNRRLAAMVAELRVILGIERDDDDTVTHRPQAGAR